MAKGVGSGDVVPVGDDRISSARRQEPLPTPHAVVTQCLSPYVRRMSVQAITWSPTGAVRVVDQRALPDTLVHRDLETIAEVADAIRTLQVRGAPLIGIAAAMGLVAGLRDARGAPRSAMLARLGEAAVCLGETRPTAVNLRWALQRMTAVAQRTPGEGAALWERLRAEATAIWEEDRAMCRCIGEAGLPLLADGANVLTHCNAGALATGGIGTALAPIYLAHEAGRHVHVFVDETRPVLQGARLTAWELTEAGVPCTLLVDGAAGSLMRAARVDLVLVGADRIARNGDFANKIGTYPVAVLARHHGVPFYCCAPSSTIDSAIPDGDAIPIELRQADEVKTLGGRAIAPAAVAAFNPAFDVTPARYVTAFLTERGAVQPPFES
jgi:methylthioribose-1-phosphate isomerase